MLLFRHCGGYLGIGPVSELETVPARGQIVVTGSFVVLDTIGDLPPVCIKYFVLSGTLGIICKSMFILTFPATPVYVGRL